MTLARCPLASSHLRLMPISKLGWRPEVPNLTSLLLVMFWMCSITLIISDSSEASDCLRSPQTQALTDPLQIRVPPGGQLSVYHIPLRLHAKAG